MAEIPFFDAWRADVSKVRGVASYQNVPPTCGRVIAAKLCTYVEAQTYLTLEDVYDLDEILMLQNYHDWLASKQREKEGYG